MKSAGQLAFSAAAPELARTSQVERHQLRLGVSLWAGSRTLALGRLLVSRRMTRKRRREDVAHRLGR
jgi:hypothetical protein